MKDTSHTARFTFTWTYSDRYHGEAEKEGATDNRGLQTARLTWAVSACRKKERVLKPVTGYSKTVIIY